MTTPRRAIPSFLACSLLAAAAIAQPTKDPAYLGPPVKPDAAPASPAAAPAAPAAAPAFVPLAHVEVKGKGPVPVILIPGLACDWSVYEAFMQRNADRYTMYAVTLPGFGVSNPPALAENSPPSDEAWLNNAEQGIIKLIADSKLDKPLVVGHSLGGYMAFHLAATQGDKFRGAVSIDGFPAFPLAKSAVPKAQRAQLVDTMIAPQLGQMSDAEWKEQNAKTMQAWIKNPERAKALGEICELVAGKTVSRYMLELLAADTTAELAGLKIPVLALAAVPESDQPEMSIEDIKTMWTDILKPYPMVTLKFIEKSHHFITEDQPAELDLAIEGFVKNPPAAHASPAPTAAVPTPASDMSK